MGRNRGTVSIREISKNSDNIVVTGYVSDLELGNLYRGCSMFLFPSLFEGFGMPPVEAMGFGKPTLVSDIPVLKEVTMGSAIYVQNPDSFDAWKIAIKDNLDKLEVVTPQFERFKQQIVSHYHPNKVSSLYLDLFETVLVNEK